MNKRTHLLAIDVGTSGVKVGIFDLEGHCLSRTGASYVTNTPRPGWIEQHPNEWWEASCHSIKAAVSQVEAANIQALCVTGLSPVFVCVGEAGEVVRPAAIWSDQRAKDETAEMVKRLGPHAAFSSLPRLLWMKRHEPENYQRTRYVFDSFDYLIFKLTGEPVCIPMTGSALPWAADDLTGAGLDPDKIPARVCLMGEVAGRLKGDVASALGLRVGLPVIAGTVDSFAAWLGTATISRGALCNTVGTTDGVAVVVAGAINDPRNRVQSIPHILERQGTRDWIVGGAMSSGGIMLDWLARRFYNHVTDAYGLINEEAASVPVGAAGLTVLPYLVGERSPINDPHARAVFFGVSETHTRAHFARAVLESVAFAVRDVCETLVEVGAEITEVRLAGSAARSDVWNQIRADVLGYCVLVPETADSSLLGAAIIAGWGAGCFEELAEAAQRMVKFRAILEPHPDHQAVYAKRFGLYRNLYAHLKDDFAELSQLTGALP